MRITTVLAAATLAGGALAQVPGNQNGMHFFNQAGSVGIQSFVNFFGAAGNVAGDCSWKILDAAGMKRGTGTHTATSADIPVFNHNFVAGGPLNIPDLEFRSTTLASSCKSPDFVAPAIGAIGIGNIVLPSQGAYTINVDFSTAAVALPDGDTAVCYLAVAGERGDATTPANGTPNACRPFGNTTGTAPGRPAGCTTGKCGRFSASANALVTNTPNFELWIEIGFSEPTVQPMKNSTLALATRGYGSYDFRVAPAGTDTLAWRVEAFQHIGKFAIPLISFTGNNSLLLLDGVPACLTLDLFSDALLALGQAGPIVSDGTAAPFTDGIHTTFAFPIPVAATNSQVHVVFYILDPATALLVDATNTVTTTFLP
ncbi:MAG: hypothetical protein IPN34_18925 [Planctomycetes bacterium]|nr:hypothetical protein [Planctomycetota bacterium]